MQLRFAWHDDPGPGWTLIHSARIRLKNGRVLLAKDYGRKSWAFWVKNRKN